MQTSLRKPILLTVLLLAALVIILVILANTAMQENRGVMNLFSIVIMLALIALVWFRYVQERIYGPATPEVREMKAQPVTLQKGCLWKLSRGTCDAQTCPNRKSEEHAHTKHEEKTVVSARKQVPERHASAPATMYAPTILIIRWR